MAAARHMLHTVALTASVAAGSQPYTTPARATQSQIHRTPRTQWLYLYLHSNQLRVIKVLISAKWKY